MSDAKMFDALSSHIDDRIREVARHDARMERPTNLGGIIREIIREELRSRTERLTWDGATIREIVREEMGGVYYPRKDFIMPPSQSDPYARVVSAPKPKTDLERAAEIIRNFEERHKECGDECKLSESARFIREHIENLKPSPDWRKIAEGLYAALFSREAKPIIDAKKAFNDAVKEESI